MNDACDVFVAGGGPSGLAAAIAARQRGLSVTVADAQSPSIDKACGEGLLPDAVNALRSLGVHFDATDSFALRGIRFISGDGSATADFPGIARGLGVRRTVLHRALVARCAQVGIVCRWEDPVLGVSGSKVEFRSGAIAARWIVGADGAQSRVRQWAGLERQRHSRTRYAFRKHFEIEPWSDYVEVYWSDIGQMYVTPVGRNMVSVAHCSRAKLRIDEALGEFPALRKRLGSARAISQERGAVTAMRRLGAVSQGNVALVGDASGTLDAITGEGLGLAFRHATALARCLLRGDLAGYAEQHEQIARHPRLIGNFLLALDRRPRLRQRTLRVFETRPAIFEKLLGLHLGAPGASLARGTLAMGWGLLTT